MSAARSVLLILIIDALGCAYATPAVHIPASIPISREALELTEVIVTKDDQPVEAELAREVRAEAAELLEDAVGATQKNGRMLVRVDLEWKYDVYDAMQEDGFAFFALLISPLGSAIGRERVSAEVIIEAGGKTFVGRGTGEKIGSIYASPRRRALATALDRALADSSEHHR